MTRLILLTLLTLSTLPAYGAWVEVNQDIEEGQTVYVDPESIRRKRVDLVEMSVLYDSKTAQPTVGKVYLSRKVQNEYNCKEDMKRMISVIEYGGNMGTGTVVYMASPLFSATKWMPVRGGVAEKLLKVACGKK
jgi:hypothetical protein